MAYLVLENGMVFEGRRIGAKKDAAGKMVFETGVVGYVETLTAPANAGLIVMQTFPAIGNYGVAEEDVQSPYTPAGYVVRTLCETPSNFRSSMDVNTFLEKKGIPGICGVDTRRLTAVLRQAGPMKAAICDDPAEACFSAAPVHFLPCRQKTHPASGAEKVRAVLWDFGARCSLIEKMNALGWTVEQVPFGEKAENILATGPDAIVIAGGPEEASLPETVLTEIRQLLGQVPVLAVGLGHELVARALSGRVTAMTPGHRGANQPVFSRWDGRTYTTSQCHSQCVDADSVKNEGESVFRNLNDDSCEGIWYEHLGCLSVQFEAEEWVLRRFQALMGGEKHA